MIGAPAFLVLDLETTGLNPDKDLILEVGAILVDLDLNEIGRFHSLVNPHADERFADAFVQRMHTATGLWKELQQLYNEEAIFPGDYETPAVAHRLHTWLLSHAVYPGGARPVIAGFSIHFDCDFLRVAMPSVLEALHYRRRDIGQIGAELEECGHPRFKPANMPHRALQDCDSELDCWRAIRRYQKSLLV